MNCPPSKRPRGPASHLDVDPFDEDFTQDDLDEIDVIASQAITTSTGEEVALREVSTMTAASGAPAYTRNSINNSNSHRNMRLRAALGSDQHLEAQQAQLKRKLAQMEEDMVLKSGEIRVLRDSLRAAQQEAETQRIRQVQLQTQQQQEQSSRERELIKKVQSLESDLQFKEAEINDMKSKLISDRRNSPLCRNSPKPQSSASPSGSFITKESFCAQVKTTPTAFSTNRSVAGASSSANRTPVKTPSRSRRQEATRADPFLSIRAPRNTSPGGGVFLGLLLQPQSPRIGLCHLLSLSPTSSLVGGGGGDVISVTGSAVSPVQSLALTGLNMMSLSRDQSSCPGAVLLLPLLHSHLSPLCSSTDTGIPACTSAAPQCTRARAKMEEQAKSRFTLEECGLVALRTLTTLLQQSQEVVEAVLSEQSQTRSSDSKAVDLVSQSSLLGCVLRLCKAPQTDITCAALNTLRVLVQRCPEEHQDRLRCVLLEVCLCVSADRRVKVVTSCVAVLTSITDHKDLTPLLCCHEPCVVLKLLHLVRSRSETEASHSDWLQLDLQVVRLLSRLLTQNSVRSTTVTCACYSELVQCVVLILHRLWLDLKTQALPTPATEASPPPHRCGNERGRVLVSLRETVLLFHWLLQNHSGFTESCRGVLHLYDQVIPAIKDSLSLHCCYSQELALEEICRSEPDDDMDTDSGF